ncbi:Calcium-dependent protein kinase 17, partial [Cymbomonas tetramitiformis]
MDHQPYGEETTSNERKSLKKTILDAQVTVETIRKPKEFDASASRTRPQNCGGKKMRQRMSCFSDMVTAGGVDRYYKLGETLGSGQYGFVVRATHKTTGREVCCKTIAKRALDDDDIDSVRREIQIMKFLDGHPNIIKLDEVFEDACNIHIIMELLSGGDLMKRASTSGRFSEKVAAKIFQGMLVGLTHAHEYGVIHRDLKLENVLLTDESDNPTPVLVDFGVSTWFKPGQIMRETVGSPLYVAPEVLKQNYSCEADLWSAGVMLYVMLSGYLPFQGESDNDVYRAILLGEYDLTTDPWPTISASAK